ncbi:Iron uptake system component EfeO [Streptomyces sp. RB5]|uniref:Iron uptake system component EfeO n=1 Tax=Streptomyces smaragdinus TaxID=2585196 RepID=A0A7K0CEL1_9ACTN|nr:iron uptake system protein EfeO [Streptomyces smaragdinus]MQY11204.1 Iron uptake system component EfeO [Streptomyces smaragdinus]
MRRTRITVAATITAAALAAAGCTAKSDDSSKTDDSDGLGPIAITASDTACEVSDKEFAAGHMQFNVENKGSKVTEVYILFPDEKILTERENIGPGTKAAIHTEIEPGTYEIACKPGMKGDGIRQTIKVTGKAKAKTEDPVLVDAAALYRDYVQQQADMTLPLAEKFAKAVKDGDLEGAKKLYAPSRIGWERTEPVAESFGDIDPKVDVREDGLEDGQKWTGWHKLEKSLWHDKKITAEDKQLADQLVTDLKDWQKRVGGAKITATSMANGAKELLDEVATGKVTGEEERYSHTDLVDFQANVEGAFTSYGLLQKVAAKNDPALTAELDKQFKSLFTLLKKYGAGEKFVSYEKVGDTQRKELSDAVNALAEPLSNLAAAVVAK